MPTSLRGVRNLFLGVENWDLKGINNNWTTFNHNIQYLVLSTANFETFSTHIFGGAGWNQNGSSCFLGARAPIGIARLALSLCDQKVSK